jgi:hypothetical protein
MTGRDHRVRRPASGVRRPASGVRRPRRSSIRGARLSGLATAHAHPRQYQQRHDDEDGDDDWPHSASLDHHAASRDAASTNGSQRFARGHRRVLPPCGLHDRGRMGARRGTQCLTGRSYAPAASAPGRAARHGARARGGVVVMGSDGGLRAARSPARERVTEGTGPSSSSPITTPRPPACPPTKIPGASSPERGAAASRRGHVDSATRSLALRLKTRGATRSRAGWNPAPPPHAHRPPVARR